MRHFLISALLLSLVSGCSSVNLGPHRIDVQQGNALDQENVARLKPGLNRSQVRFLLGTPLVVDPFRTDRWDYVYVHYKAGKLAEQKRITLFFDGETLARIEGDLPVVEPVAPPPAKPVPKPEAKIEVVTPPAAAESSPLSATPAPKADPIPAPKPAPISAPKVEPAQLPQPVAAQPVAQTTPVKSAPKAAVQPQVTKPAAASTAQPVSSPAVESSIVPPLPSPKNVPVYVDPRPPAELSLQPETNVTQIRPDVIPDFPVVSQAGAVKSDEFVLSALNAWADAWQRRDVDAYLAAYDAGFLPQGGGSRADWEKNRRQMMSAAKHIEIKIDSASVDRTEEGAAKVTFNQIYRSDRYRDVIVKQLLMAERDGRWLILEENVLSKLQGAKQ